jgi:hypothetical protein
MSTGYLNPRRQYPQINEKLLEIISLGDQHTQQDKFFILLDQLNCLINLFFAKRTFSITDCCQTVDSIWDLFQQNEDNYFSINRSQQLDEILKNEDYNIFKFEVESNFPYHTFVLVYYQQNWYLLQSFTNVCELNVTKDELLPIYLKDFLETGSVQLYNLLFKTSFKTNGESTPIRYEITVGKYQELPTNRLIQLIEDYVI